jgi:DNA-binding MarR family transcriptional regulator
MPLKITSAQYQALAELRHRIIHFISSADATALKYRLEPQQYFLLLAVRGLPEGSEASVRTLAERMSLRHNSTVELIDRLEAHGYLERRHSQVDRRCVLVRLLPRGEKILEKVARERITELHGGGAALASAIQAVLKHTWRSAGKTRAKSMSKKVGRKNRG